MKITNEIIEKNPDVLFVLEENDYKKHFNLITIKEKLNEEDHKKIKSKLKSFVMIYADDKFDLKIKKYK